MLVTDGYAETVGNSTRGTTLTIRYGSRDSRGEFIPESRDERLARLTRQYELARAELQRALDEHGEP